MSKNIQATFWAGLALMAVITAVVAVRRQLPVRPVTKTAAHKVSKPASIAETLTNLFIPNAAPASIPANTVSPAVSTSTPSAATGQIYRREIAPKVPIPSYGDMVTQYQNTRIQFGPDCEAHPNQIAIANPVTLMLDNRSSGWEKITIGKAVYNVAAYNYVLATINETTLPMIIQISCNQQENTAEIILQR